MPAARWAGNASFRRSATRSKVPEEDYRQALDTACREWERLAAQRADLDSRLADLQRTIVSLMRLCGLEPTVRFGWTDACCLILSRHRGQALSARRVKEGLELARCAPRAPPVSSSTGFRRLNDITS